MTNITLEREIADSSEVFEALKEAIRDLRHEVEGLAQQARSGEEISETAVKSRLATLTGLVTHCAKAENTLNDCRNRQAGIARDGIAFDLEQARAEIGCKLDKLRCAGRSG